MSDTAGWGDRVMKRSGEKLTSILCGIKTRIAKRKKRVGISKFSFSF
jgi:hypothetical protein